MDVANTADSIISHTRVVGIAYLASPDSSGSLGIIIYFLRRKYPASKAAKGLIHSGMTCVRGITQFYLSPTRLSTNGMNHSAFTP